MRNSSGNSIRMNLVSTPFISKRFCAFSAISGIGGSSIVTGTGGWMQFEFGELNVVLFSTLLDDRTICASRFLAIIAELSSKQRLSASSYFLLSASPVLSVRLRRVRESRMG